MQPHKLYSNLEIIVDVASELCNISVKVQVMGLSVTKRILVASWHFEAAGAEYAAIAVAMKDS